MLRPEHGDCPDEQRRHEDDLAPCQGGSAWIAKEMSLFAATGGVGDFSGCWTLLNRW
jgi:hypothetical protein